MDFMPRLYLRANQSHPAFVRVDDLSILPNDFRRDITFVYFLGGSAIKDSTQTTIISTEGTAQEFVEGSDMEKARKSMFAGAGEGLSMGLSKIGDFYMSIIEDMVPVVRIDGGRDVEIKLTEGVELKLEDNDWTWAGEIEETIQ
jgi:hypothetical protein